MEKIDILENKRKLDYDDWNISYGVCDECGVDVIRVDEGSWLDDSCHRHQFSDIVAQPYTVWRRK